MFIKIINFLIKMHLTFVAESIMRLVSYIFSHRHKFSYSNGFWILSDLANKCYVDFIIDPRLNLEKDICQLLRDVFFYKYSPNHGDTVLTIGSGLGHELLILNEVMGNSGNIVCVEALPALIPGLQMTISKNKFNNCEIFNYAIGKKDNTFIEISNRPDGHLSRSVYEEKKSQVVKVPVVTMDTFCEMQNIKLVDFLCVNIEGAELDLIANFKSIKIVKNISISCHDFLYQRDPTLDPNVYCTFDRVKDFLISNNFEISVRNTGTDFKDFYIYGVNKLLDKSI